MKAEAIVAALLEAGPDDVEAKDYLRQLPAVSVGQWVFSNAELQAPQHCRAGDEMVATITVKENEEDEDDEDFLVHIIVLRDGTATNRFAISPNWQGPDPALAAIVNFDAPVPQNLQDMAAGQTVMFNPLTNQIADDWKHVMADSEGNFVRWISS